MQAQQDEINMIAFETVSRLRAPYDDIQEACRRIRSKRQVDWKGIKPKVSTLDVCREDFDLISSEYLPRIRELICSLQNELEVGNLLLPHEDRLVQPSAPSAILLAELINKILDQLLNILKSKSSREIVKLDFIAVEVERIMRATRTLHAIKDILLGLLLIYSAHLVDLSDENSSRFEADRIVSLPQQLNDLVDGVMKSLACPDQKTSKANVRSMDNRIGGLDPSNDLFFDAYGHGNNKIRTNLQFAQELYYLRIQLVLSQFGCEETSRWSRRRAETPYPKLSKHRFKSIFSEHLPALRCQFFSLRDTLDPKNLTSPIGKITAMDSIFRLSGQISRKLSKILIELDFSLVRPTRLQPPADGLIVPGKLIENAGLEADELLSNWSLLVKSYKRYLSGSEFTTTELETQVQVSYWLEIESQLEKCLRLTDQAIKQFDRVDGSDFSTSCQLLSRSLSQKIKEVRDPNDKILTMVRNGTHGYVNGGTLNEDFRKLIALHQSKLIVWNWIKVLFRLMVDKSSLKDLQRLKAIDGLDECQLLELGHEFQYWVQVCFVSYKMSRGRTSYDTSFEKKVEQILKSLKKVFHIFFNKVKDDTTGEVKGREVEKMNLAKCLGEVKVDENDEYRLWIKVWFEEVILVLQRSFKTHKTFSEEYDICVKNGVEGPYEIFYEYL
ncbi:hypothetical protein BY996DRAFT_7124423 [Phakopsora pachyrhizi]|nr:hypothetical protein BY996DRAFT_7124423 [Phakopsora pachyrhizi]